MHIRNWAGNGDFEDEYEAEKKRLGGVTDASHRLEAIAYLWQAWLKNYYIWGGLTNVLPSDKWKVPPRWQVADAIEEL